MKSCWSLCVCSNPRIPVVVSGLVYITLVWTVDKTPLPVGGCVVFHISKESKSVVLSTTYW
jgi:hypothetical protein